VSRRLRRFARVTTTVTGVDLGVLALLRRLGASVAAADATSVAVASVASWRLHRSLTLGDDPRLRWVRQPGLFAGTALVAGAVDVAVTSVLAHRAPLVVAKPLGLAAAAGVRFVGYRAVLLTDTRRELGAKRSHDGRPAGAHRLTVVVPAYGEADRIGGTVARLRDGLADIDLEVLVVDDGSPDATAAEAEAAGARVLRLERNRGKGAAVRAGVLAAQGRTVAFTDADLAYDPSHLRTLLVAVEEGWDVVVGNRWHRDSAAGVQPLVRRISSRLFNLLTATVLLGQWRDTQCGLKAFRADAARQVFGRTRLDGFAFDVEVLHLVERDRLSMTEVPVTVAHDERSTVHVRRAAVDMVRDLLRVRRWSADGLYDLDRREV
jgi:putative flippase GtrA